MIGTRRAIGSFRWVLSLAYLALLPLIVLVQLLQRKSAPLELLWGPVPIINNKYWSEAMVKAGWPSKTLMMDFYPAINRRDDFDIYYDDLIPGLKPALLAKFVGPIAAHLYVVRHAKVMHIPFSGGPLGQTALWWLEAFLYRLSGVKTVVIPYGADIYRYSRIDNPSVRNALMLSYPDAARMERSIERRVSYWTRHADVIVMGFTLEGVGRWDIPVGNMVCIDTDLWRSSEKRGDADGRKESVRILHAPNHRGAKGTEFLTSAVSELQRAGLKIELVLVEKTQNDRLRELMKDVDILADQFVLPGYGLAAIEGMASGLPVLANLDDEQYVRIFRRYSFLNECPILSTTPETLLANLKLLVTNPGLRRILGEAGRRYVEKYHSYETAQYLFGSIYKKILENEDVDLMNLFHPLKSPYNRSKPIVEHPLTENHLPPDYPLSC